MPKEAVLYIYGYSSKTDAYIVLMTQSFVENTFIIYLHTYKEGSICWKKKMSNISFINNP